MLLYLLAMEKHNSYSSPAHQRQARCGRATAAAGRTAGVGCSGSSRHFRFGARPLAARSARLRCRAARSGGGAGWSRAHRRHRELVLGGAFVSLRAASSHTIAPAGSTGSTRARIEQCPVKSSRSRRGHGPVQPALLSRRGSRTKVPLQPLQPAAVVVMLDGTASRRSTTSWATPRGTRHSASSAIPCSGSRATST